MSTKLLIAILVLVVLDTASGLIQVNKARAQCFSDAHEFDYDVVYDRGNCYTNTATHFSWYGHGEAKDEGAK